MNDTQTAEWKKTACIIYCGGGRQGNQLVSTYADSTIKALGVVYRSNALVQPGHGCQGHHGLDPLQCDPRGNSY